MANYLRTFETESEFLTYLSGNDFSQNTVCVVKETNNVYYCSVNTNYVISNMIPVSSVEQMTDTTKLYVLNGELWCFEGGGQRQPLSHLKVKWYHFLQTFMTKTM